MVVIGATFLVFSFSFSSFVTDLNTQSFVSHTCFANRQFSATNTYTHTHAHAHRIARGRNKRQLRQNSCEGSNTIRPLLYLQTTLHSFDKRFLFISSNNRSTMCSCLQRQLSKVCICFPDVSAASRITTD